MKKIFYLLIALIPFLTSCEEKETEGISRVTVYAEITVEGADPLIIKKGETFTDPGATSSGGEEIIVRGNVNTNQAGFYPVTYVAYNEDGFPAEAARTVVVYEEDDVLAGLYDGKRVGRSGGLVLIYSNGDGTYSCTDLLGGWYEFGTGYGNAYAAPTDRMVLDGSTITADNGVCAFGPVGISGGTKSGDVLTWDATLLNHAFGFGVQLTKRNLN